MAFGYQNRGLPLSLALLGAIAGCHHATSLRETDTPPGAALAIVSDTSASFIFPADTIDVYQWNGPRPGRPNRSVAGAWTVSWVRWSSRFGHEPDMLAHVVYWVPSDSIRRGDLHAVAATGDTWVGTSDDGVAVRVDAVSGLTAAVLGGRMVLQVQGREAMRRVFPSGVPDSVRFSTRWADGDDVERKRRVERRRQPSHDF
jgi:hypothetical protein